MFASKEKDTTILPRLVENNYQIVLNSNQIGIDLILYQISPNVEQWINICVTSWEGEDANPRIARYCDYILTKSISTICPNRKLESTFLFLKESQQTATNYTKHNLYDWLTDIYPNC